MQNKKTGISMCGSIEYIRKGNRKKFIDKIEKVKKQNAKICLECKSNKEGYCNKHKGWCGKVNYICNGYDQSYSDKLQENKYKKELKRNRKKKKHKKG